jgi:hypothetical protein
MIPILVTIRNNIIQEIIAYKNTKKLIEAFKKKFEENGLLASDSDIEDGILILDDGTSIYMKLVERAQ